MIMFKEVVDSIRIKLPKGRPRTRPGELLADPAYDTTEIRKYLRNRGIQSNIPCNRRNSKTSRSGRPVRLDDKSYKHRGAVERFFAWLLSFKRIIIRHERLVRIYQAFINLASILILWRVLK
ncbi:MAG: transposase [Methanocellales archaeon]|nr:transposase [Methanocellales archaeon]